MSALRSSYLVVFLTSGVWTLFTCLCFSRERLVRMPTAAYELSELVYANGTWETLGLTFVYLWLAGVLLALAYSMYSCARQLGTALSIQNTRAVLPPLFAVAAFALVIGESRPETVNEIASAAGYWLMLLPVAMLLVGAAVSFRRKKHES